MQLTAYLSTLTKSTSILNDVRISLLLCQLFSLFSYLAAGGQAPCPYIWPRRKKFRSPQKGDARSGRWAGRLGSSPLEAPCRVMRTSPRVADDHCLAHSGESVSGRCGKGYDKVCCLCGVATMIWYMTMDYAGRVESLRVSSTNFCK